MLQNEGNIHYAARQAVYPWFGLGRIRHLKIYSQVGLYPRFCYHDPFGIRKPETTGLRLHIQKEIKPVVHPLHGAGGDFRNQFLDIQMARDLLVAYQVSRGGAEQRGTNVIPPVRVIKVCHVGLDDGYVGSRGEVLHEHVKAYVIRGFAVHGFQIIDYAEVRFEYAHPRSLPGFERTSNGVGVDKGDGNYKITCGEYQDC